MNKKKIYLVCGILTVFLVVSVFAYRQFSYYNRKQHEFDVAIKGPLLFADGIGRQSIGLIDALHKTHSIFFYRTNQFDKKDLPENILKIVSRKRQKKANVLIYEAPLVVADTFAFPDLPEAEIRVAYSMIESTRLPDDWVWILNNNFDAVAVPDRFLVNVYKNSGVKIPIFEMPLGIYVEPFLANSAKRSKPFDRPFVFGCLGSILPRKNQLGIINAFAKVFKNNPEVFLVINGRYADSDYLNELKQTIDSLDLRNISLSTSALEWNQYIKAISRFDCYLNPSKGEGFSIQPREAIALGIPTILTDNTAQSTVCKSGYACSVPSEKAVPAHYYNLKGWEDSVGEQFECSIDDLAAAMKDVYDNYDSYAQKALDGRQWVERYSYEHLSKLYQTLILPENVVYSDHDEIKDGTVYCSSERLCKKYEKILNKQTLLRKFLNHLIIKRYQ